MISLIWAMDEENAIGKDNVLPWHYKEDLLYFRECIKNHKVLMGMNTYESILSYRKSLFPNSTYYIATRRRIRIDGVEIVSDLNSFIKKKFDDELFVIGGASVYKATLPYANKLYVTIVKGTHNGDAFFPEIDYGKFKLISSKMGENPDLEFRVYERY